jgi:hypothetical protein
MVPILNRFSIIPYKKRAALSLKDMKSLPGIGFCAWKIETDLQINIA